MRRVGIVDYGAGNMFSVSRGLREVGVKPTWIQDAEDCENVDAILLPGVGAFGESMRQLRARGFDKALLEAARDGKPILGVCVGMQLLFSRSFELGDHNGLGILQGTVVRIEPSPGWPSPNTGWRRVRARRKLDGTPFSKIEDGDAFYFAHSFECQPDDPKAVLLEFEYGGRSVCAAVKAGSVTGCQFHPEISGAAGLKIYRTFFSAT